MKKLIYLILGIFQFGLSQELNYIHYDDLDGLPSNEVYGFEFDGNGFLWFATDKGISIFDGKNFVNKTSQEGFSDDVIFNITKDNYDRMWLWNYNLTFNFVKKNKVFQYEHSSKLTKSNRDYNGIYIGSGKNKKMFFHINEEYISIDVNGKKETYNNIYFGKNYIVTRKKDKFENEGIKNFPLKFFEESRSFRNNKDLSIILPYDDSYLLFIKNKLYFLKENTKIEERAFKNDIISVCMDNKKRIWISLVNNNLILINNFWSKERVIFNNSSGKLEKDEVGNIWFSNSYNGIYKFPNSFIESYELKNTNIIKSIFFYNNKLYSETYNGNRYHINEKIQIINKPLVFNIDSLLIPENSKVEYYGYSDISNDRIKSIQKQNNNYYLLTSEGIDFIDKSKKKQTILRSNMILKDFYVIGKNDIYLASIKGLFHTENGNKSFKNILENTEYENAHIQVIKKYKNYLIIGTKGKGLIWYSLKDKKIHSIYNSDNRNFCKSINCLYIDGNILWVGSNRGIYIYKLWQDKMTFENILNANNGLKNNDVLQIMQKNKTLYATTKNSINIIDLTTKDLFTTLPPTQPIINKIIINGKENEFQQNIEIPYNKNDFNIEFISPYLSDNSRLSYYYQLKGKDTKWINTNENTVTYNNLEPGNYVFEIYSNLDFGKVKSKPTILKFKISQPFWESSVFKALLVLFILVIIFSSISYYFYRKSVQNKRKRELIEHEQIALRAKMKPHFIFNSLNSIQNFILKNDKNIAIDFIEKFSQLTRAILVYSEKELISLKEELEVSSNYLYIEQCRFNNFDFNIDVSRDINTEKIMFPSLILQPLLENSIWHGLKANNENSRGLINILINQESNYLILKLIDNGVGLNSNIFKNTNHKSLGLELLRKRLHNLYAQNFEFTLNEINENSLILGTIAILKIPINKNENI